VGARLLFDDPNSFGIARFVDIQTSNRGAKASELDGEFSTDAVPRASHLNKRQDVYLLDTHVRHNLKNAEPQTTNELTVTLKSPKLQHSKLF